MFENVDENTVYLFGQPLSEFSRQKLVNAIAWCGKWLAPIKPLDAETHSKIFGNPDPIWDCFKRFTDKHPNLNCGDAREILLYTLQIKDIARKTQS